jgi:hypothetical protein
METSAKRDEMSQLSPPVAHMSQRSQSVTASHTPVADVADCRAPVADVAAGRIPVPHTDTYTYTNAEADTERSSSSKNLLSISICLPGRVQKAHPTRRRNANVESLMNLSLRSRKHSRPAGSSRTRRWRCHGEREKPGNWCGCCARIR